MRKLDLAALLQKTVRRLNQMRAGVGSSIQLSLPLNVPEFCWHDCSLEKLIERLIRYATLISLPTRPVRIAVHQKRKMPDLEKFFGIHPLNWIQLRIGPAAAGFEQGFRQILEDHGYRCEEWVGVEDSSQQLGSFYLEVERQLKLVFWIDNRRFCSKCALLIPIPEST